MGSHYQHAAFHMAKRDEDPFGDNNDNGAPKVITVTSKVYVTEPKTFPGPAVYVTKTPVVETINNPKPTMNSYESAKSVVNQPKTRSGNPYLSPTAVKGTPMSQDGDAPSGMSGGAKAGVAIGVLLSIALIGGLIFFCLRRKKKQQSETGERIDEKHVSKNSFFSGTAAAFGSSAGDKRASFRSTHSAATAPRLSLRPVTQFLPVMGGNKNLEVPAMSEKSRSASPQNPFHDSTEKNPFEEGDGAAKVAAAVPVGGAKQNNVHRVQLDFKPSMDDELELKSGQLVRMIHEYDDGWALCMRMDRTQQGVCPRTCLSKVPVKPRPQGAPNGRNSPPGARPPPQGPDNKMAPRPLTPNGRERSNTDGQGFAASPAASLDSGRIRSQSMTGSTDGRVSPVEGGMPARKPLPGQ